VARLDERSFNRAMATLGKYENRPFRLRVRKAFEAAGRLLVGPMRRMAPYRTGGLKGSITMRHRRPLPLGTIVSINVKPRANAGGPHGHLLSQGHRVVNAGGDTGSFYQGTDFVGKTIRGHESRAVKLLSEQPLDISGVNVSSLNGVLQGFK
jgi:hypothetical protein